MRRRNFKIKKIASILIALVMAITVVPFMGENVYGQDVSQQWTQQIKTGGQTNYTNQISFNVPTGYVKLLKIRKSIKDGSGSDVGMKNYIDVKVKDTSGNVVNPISDSTDPNYYNHDYQYNYKLDSSTAAHTYMLDITINSAALGSIPRTFTVDATVTDYISYSYKYSSLTATLGENQSHDKEVRLSVGSYDGRPDAQTRPRYGRLNTKTNMFKYLGSSSVDNKLDIGASYRYYVVDYSQISSQESTLNTASNSEVAYSTVRSVLENGKFTTSSVINVPDKPYITKPNNVRYDKGYKSANIIWDCPEYNTSTLCNEAINVDGYIIKRYAKGGSEALATYDVNYGGSEWTKEKKIYIPYSGTSTIKITAYCNKNNTKYYSDTVSFDCESKKISASTGSVTKISDKKAKLTINKATGSNGTVIYQYTGGKWKKLATTTASKYTVSKNKAGKAKYKFKAYIKDGSKTYYSSKYSSTYSPKANKRTWSYSSYPSYYKDLSHYWRPVSIYYSGNKVMLKGKFISTHIYNMRYFDVKVKIKCDGKVIGSKTIKAGKINSNTCKKHSAVVISTKSGYDLRFADWSYSIIRAD